MWNSHQKLRNASLCSATVVQKVVSRYHSDLLIYANLLIHSKHSTTTHMTSILQIYQILQFSNYSNNKQPLK